MFLVYVFQLKNYWKNFIWCLGLVQDFLRIGEYSYYVKENVIKIIWRVALAISGIFD